MPEREDLGAAAVPPAAAAWVVLASASAARADVLREAGVAFTVEPAAIDEVGQTASMIAEGADGAAVAAALADRKARQVANRHPGALVVGADQVLACEGRLFGKPNTLAQARADLCALRGRTHELLSAVCVVRDGASLWRHLSRARLHMRSFSDAFLDRHLEASGASALASVGAYQIEGVGAQLFSRIEGDHFAILGLPLLPLLEFLRGQGIVAA